MNSSMNNSLRYASAGQIELRVDYMDVYSATFFAPCQIVVESSVKQFFFSIPRFFIGLLWIREVIGKRLGLKTAKGKTATLGEIERFKGQIGDSIALFHVWDRQANAIVTGQRDKHLDFVLVFTLTNQGRQHTLELTTAVQIKSGLGRIYLWAVKPIHWVLMPILLKRLCHRLSKGCY